ncbi:hypothetical protein ACFYXC_40210 [Streptomyces sp. NPDC002701]
MNRRPAHLTEREEQILACIRRSIARCADRLSVMLLGPTGHLT